MQKPLPIVMGRSEPRVAIEREFASTDESGRGMQRTPSSVSAFVVEGSF